MSLIRRLQDTLWNWINPATEDKQDTIIARATSVISSNNSSITPLLASNIFTWTSDDVSQYNMIIISVKSDVGSAIDWLSIQFSTDNINFDHIDTYTIPWWIWKTFTTQPVAKYFRIVYTNWAVNQTYFRLQVQLKSWNTKPSSHRIQDNISSDDDAELTKSVLTYDSNWVFSNIWVQTPFPNWIDSIYSLDIKDSLTEIWTFTGSILSCFDNLDNEIIDSSITNPKWFKFYTERPVINQAINMTSKTWNFSNVKIELYDRANTLIYTLDDSSNSTKYTSHKYDFWIQKEYCCVKISFLTIDPINISFIRMLKEQRISLSNIDKTSNSLLTQSFSLNSLWAWNHYISRLTSAMAASSTEDLLIVTPNTTKWAHMIIVWESQDWAVSVTLYEDTVTSSDWTRDNERNRNRNYPDNNTTLVYTSPTVTSVWNIISQWYFWSWKPAWWWVRDSEEMILKQNTKYLVRVTNETTSVNHVNVFLDWYEHINIV